MIVDALPHKSNKNQDTSTSSVPLPHTTSSDSVVRNSRICGRHRNPVKPQMSDDISVLHSALFKTSSEAFQHTFSTITDVYHVIPLRLLHKRNLTNMDSIQIVII